MLVKIHKEEQSKPIEIDNVINAYTKGPLYCVVVEKDGVKEVQKYPLCNIFRIVEPY